jgi:hypothetical protein
VWDPRTGKEQANWKSRSIPRGLAFSPDGQRVAVGSSESWGYGGDVGWGELWDSSAARRLITLAGHSENINDIEFARNGRVVTGSFDFDVRQWETFPWREKDYAGEGALPTRIRSYADDYWRRRYTAERSGETSTPTREFDFSRDRSSWPPRDPNDSSRQIDLTSHYEGLLTAVFDPCFLTTAVDDDLSCLPRGLQPLGGVTFDLRGVIQLRPFEARLGPFRRAWESWPEAVSRIWIEQSFRKLHLLHGTKGSLPDGTVIARLVCHYADGEQTQFDIAYARDVRHWWYQPGVDDRQSTDRAAIAWTGSNPVAERNGSALRLYLSTWDSPRPDIAVETLDYVSARTSSAPFLIAITVE